MSCSRRTGRLEERRHRIGERFDLSGNGERLDVLRERRPARAGAGGAAITSGRGGMGGSRSELQAGSGGPSDRPDPFCEPPMDPGGEVELMDALNSSIENKTFCPDTRGPGLTRLSASPDWRCYARNWARSQVSDRGGRGFPPVPPGWMFFEDDQTFWWVRRQSPELSDAKEALFGSERGPDNREDLCAAAQRFSYKNIGVGHHRDVWVIFISPFD